MATLFSLLSYFFKLHFPGAPGVTEAPGGGQTTGVTLRLY